MNGVKKTNEIEEVLNRIGDYTCIICEEEIPLIGVLRREERKENSIVFQSRMSIEHFHNLDKTCEKLQLWGNVNGILVTLMSVCFRDAKIIDKGDMYDVTFFPNEIIIGRSYREEPRAWSIEASITALNSMFSQSPFDDVHNFSKENPYLLKYAFPSNIATEDPYGQLVVRRSLSRKWTRNEIKHTIIPIIEYRFNEATGIMDALGRIMAVRNLFAFFANRYLPVESIIFADADSQKVGSDFLCDIVYYLNPKENIAVRDEPFLICTADFEKDFMHIWQNWLEMYEGAAPISTLFYEIICNRSTGFNCFLNLAQSIEVYSCQYREAKVRELVKQIEAETGNEAETGKKQSVYLKHRFQDIFVTFNDCFEVEESDISILAKNLADMRNYYTHYNYKRYTKPSYQEMFSATHLLRFMLLVIVYKTLGLNTEAIIKARKRVEFQRYDEDISIILNYATKQN